MSCTHSPDSTVVRGLCPQCLVTLTLEDRDQPGPLTPGLVLNERFRINAFSGRGGMGEVYRADDLTLGQVVALKFVPSDSPTQLERLRNEVRLGRQVSHPNVCRLYELLEFEGQPFVVMEFIDGEDLGALMSRIRRLPTPTALALGRQICAGLAASHDRNIVHGDLKPSNVMVDALGHARITDFGLSTFAEEHGTVAGTLAYMAPEQLDGSRTKASDIYSLGAVLFEMFAGRRLRDASTIEEMKASIAAPPDPQYVKKLPAGIRQVVMQCLSTNPASRPASVRNVLAAFPGGDLLDAAVAAGETPSPELVAAAEHVQPFTRGTALLTIAAAIACLAIVASLNARRGAIAMGYADTVYLVLLPILLIGGVIAARRNIRLGRVDSRGAWRIALWMMGCRMIAWLFEAEHVASLTFESRLVATGLSQSLFSAAQGWLGYVAVEPYIRRRRPQTIIGWRRLLDGNLFDRIVGREVLAGVAIGSAMAVLNSCRLLLGSTAVLARVSRSAIAVIFYMQTRAIFYALFALFLLILLRNVFRPRLVGSIVWLLVVTAVFAGSVSPVDVVLSALLAVILLFTLGSSGFLSATTALFAYLSLTLTISVAPIAVVLALLAIAGLVINGRV